MSFYYVPNVPPCKPELVKVQELRITTTTAWSWSGSVNEIVIEKYVHWLPKNLMIDDSLPIAWTLVGSVIWVTRYIWLTYLSCSLRCLSSAPMITVMKRADWLMQREIRQLTSNFLNVTCTPDASGSYHAYKSGNCYCAGLLMLT